MHDYRHTAEQYRQANVGSMTPERLIVALYERMLRDLEDARTALAAGKRPELNTKVIGVQNIITELRNALDYEIGGEIARNLDAIYDYVFQELLLVIVDQDAAHLDDATAVLEPLLEAWSQVPAGAGEKERRRRIDGQTGAGPNPATGQGEPRDGSPLEADRAAEGMSTLSVTV
ncbi:MAG: flagellar export chaperone FliS [bacterium]|nr:flagellar export chaperone FliS [bacterium]